MHLFLNNFLFTYFNQIYLLTIYLVIYFIKKNFTLLFSELFHVRTP